MSLRSSLMSACVVMVGAAAHAEEPKMQLDLTTTVTRSGGQVRVVCSLANVGQSRAAALVDPEFAALTVTLTDAAGAAVVPMDRASAGGMSRPHDGPPHVVELAPGAGAELLVFFYADKQSQATAGSLYWPLADRRGQQLTLTFGYAVAESFSTGKRPVASGNWHTRPLPLAIPAWDVESATFALGNKVVVRDPAMLPTILATLSSGDALARATAAQSLGELKAPSAVDVLVKTLAHDHDREVRRAAAAALGDIRDPRSRPALAEAAHADTDEAVRLRATRALMALDEPPVSP